MIWYVFKKMFNRLWYLWMGWSIPYSFAHSSDWMIAFNLVTLGFVFALDLVRSVEEYVEEE